MVWERLVGENAEAREEGEAGRVSVSGVESVLPPSDGRPTVAIDAWDIYQLC